MSKALSCLAMILVSTVVGATGASAQLVTSQDRRGERVVKQVLEVSDSVGVRYFLKVTDPAGVAAICATLRLETRGKDGWRPFRRAGGRPVHECAPRANSIQVGIDVFLHPPPGVLERLMQGRLRAHGFSDGSTSLVISLSQPARRI